MYADKPQTIGQAVLSSLRLYRDSATKVLILGLLWGLIWQSVQIALQLLAVAVMDHHYIWQLIVSMVISLFLLIWLGGGMYNLMDQAGRGCSLSVGKALWSVRSALVRLILTFVFFIAVFYLLSQLITFSSQLLLSFTGLSGNSVTLGAIVVFCIAGIVIGIYCMLLEPLIVVDDLSFVQAIKQSVRLMKGNFWYSFAIVFWPFFILLMLFNFIPIVFNMAQQITQQAMFWAQIVAVPVVLITIFLPWIVSSILIVRYNVKLNEEVDKSLEETSTDTTS